MNAPDKRDDLDDVDLAALSTRVLHDIVAKMTPEDRQRYRDALDAADAPLRSFLGAALGTPETSDSAPGKKCAICRGAFSGMSWDTLCPSCWEEKVRNESAARRAQSSEAVRDATLEEISQVLKMSEFMSVNDAADYILTRRSKAPTADRNGARIQFPTHLRKMWSGGEVQAWLDEHQGVTAPRPSTKGSLEGYRAWQAEQAAAPCSCPSSDSFLR